MKNLKLIIKAIMFIVLIFIFLLTLNVVGFAIYGSILDEQNTNKLREMKFKQDSILVELHLKRLNVGDTLVIINSQMK